jgi:hypothetical protein
MATVGDLINKGFILDQRSEEKGRTFIVTGLYRSGTSLVASVLQRAGLFIGSEINDIVFEDETINRILSAGLIETLPPIIGARNADHATWGFKHPMLWQTLTATQLRLFDAPRLIITFRDPVSVAIRTSLSEYQEPMRALRDAVADLSSLMAFIGELKCPYLLLSYEKALTAPRDFIDVLMRFCDIPCDDELRGQLLGMIELNRPTYLASARRRFDGLLEGVHGDHLYGWCQLTRSPEPVVLDVLVDDRMALSVTADVFRQDLLDAGVGSGSHGYFVPLEALRAQPDSVIRVKVSRHDIELDNSGRRLSDYGTV